MKTESCDITHELIPSTQLTLITQITELAREMSVNPDNTQLRDISSILFRPLTEYMKMLAQKNYTVMTEGNREKYLALIDRLREIDRYGKINDILPLMFEDARLRGIAEHMSVLFLNKTINIWDFASMLIGLRNMAGLPHTNDELNGILQNLDLTKYSTTEDTVVSAE